MHKESDSNRPDFSMLGELTAVAEIVFEYMKSFPNGLSIAIEDETCSFWRGAANFKIRSDLKAPQIDFEFRGDMNLYLPDSQLRLYPAENGNCRCSFLRIDQLNALTSYINTANLLYTEYWRLHKDLQPVLLWLPQYWQRERIDDDVDELRYLLKEFEQTWLPPMPSPPRETMWCGTPYLEECISWENKVEEFAQINGLHVVINSEVSSEKNDSLDLKSLSDTAKQFAVEREWEQFHSPKNLIMAMAVEVSELMEHFQWLTAEESELIALPDDLLNEVRLEMADVLIYLLRLSERLNVDLMEAAIKKMKINAKRYPVDIAKGNATKYNRRKR